MLECGGDEVSIMPGVCPLGQLASHHLVIFHMLVFLLNLLVLPFISLLDHAIFKIILRRRGEGGIINPYQDKVRREEWRNQMRVKVQSNLVVGFGELIPMESGYDTSVEQNTDMVTKDNE